MDGGAAAMDNQSLSRVLHDIADVLEIKGESFFRIRSYRLSAESVGSHGDDVADMIRRGTTWERSPASVRASRPSFASWSRRAAARTTTTCCPKFRGASSTS